MEENKNLDTKLEKTIIDFCESLTDEQKEKVKTGELQGELLKVLGKEGIALPDDVLESVSGGLWPFDPKWWPEGTFMRRLMEKIC